VAGTGRRLEVALSAAQHATLRSLLLADPDCERTIHAARRVGRRVLISGDADELEHLAGFIAAEANHQSNRRRRGGTRRRVRSGPARHPARSIVVTRRRRLVAIHDWDEVPEFASEADEADW